MSFKNRIVLVTGGASGIGGACSEAFAKEGANVVLNYLSSEESAQRIASKFPGRVFPIQGDMSREDDVKRIFEEGEKKFGMIGILVNNAGIPGRTKFPSLTADAFLEMLRVNTVGPYLVSREFAVRLAGGSGVIVNIGSMRACLPGGIDYSASKAAVHNMTVSLAKAVAPHIRVNTVAPGFTDTGMHEGNRQRLEREGGVSLLQRYSVPSDIADAVLFMASEKAKSITGQVLLVDNGRSLT